MSKDLWMIQYEGACEDFYAGVLDENTFRLLLRQLGFDAQEIDDHLTAAVGEAVIERARSH